VAQVAESILPSDEFFRVADGAGDIDENHIAAIATHEVVVMLVRVAQLVVTPGPLEIHFMNETEFFH
jgi:hypothetical protein